MDEAEQSIIDLIAKNPLCDYADIVELSPYSPTTINKILTKLKKQKKVEVVEVQGRKAKGWRKC